jgi:predicted outer membrane lipoprotein
MMIEILFWLFVVFVGLPLAAAFLRVLIPLLWLTATEMCQWPPRQR